MDEWKELDLDSVAPIPKRRIKRLKLFADANIPKSIVDEIRNGGHIPVVYAQELGLGTVSDEQIRAYVQRKNLVLLTLDRDFWNESIHPIQHSPGIIFIDEAPDDLEGILRAFVRFWVFFAKYWPHDYWPQMKARITKHDYTIRLVSYEGRISETQYKVVNGRVYERVIR